MLSITIIRYGPETSCFLLIAVPRLDVVSLWILITKAGRKFRILFKLNSWFKPLLENLYPASDLRMHSPHPYYLHTDPCIIPPSNVRETQKHWHTEVQFHLCLGWMPQQEDLLSCPPNFPCLSPFPMTMTHGEAAEVAVPSCTISKDIDNHPNISTASDPAMQRSPLAGPWG